MPAPVTRSVPRSATRSIGALLLVAACAPPAPPVTAPPAGAHPPSPGAALVARSAAADSAFPCPPELQVAEVHNPLPERAFVSITTNVWQVFYLDTPFAPDEVRRVRLPARMRAMRADAASEPWRVAPSVRLTAAQQVRQEATTIPRSQMTRRIYVRMACAG